MGLKLLSTDKIFLDTSPFIYFFEENPAYIEKLGNLFDRIYAGGIPIITSIITYIELLIYPEKTGAKKLAAKYRESLINSEFISVYPMNLPVADTAVTLRVKYSLKTPDAIQVATAVVCGADYVITNDRKWKKIKDVNVVLISEI
ncbi:MAG: PIN domain-containing protein [Candidatus Omnitrophica bacterium]|nr:PIN domain-containing protein [Candidatus Omnitrophota bacterium]